MNRMRDIDCDDGRILKRRRKKKVEEIIDALNLILKKEKLLMKTIQEAVDEVKAVKTDLTAHHGKLTEYFTEVLAAINRLEAKIVAGADAQPVVDELGGIKQAILDKNAELDVKIAEAKVTGL